MATLTVQCGAGDCWCDKAGNFSSTGTQLYVIDSPGVTNSNVRTWIPFSVPIRNVQVQQATITVRTNSAGAGTGTIRFACEAADNPATPVSAADLSARVLASTVHDIGINPWTNETDYTFTITGTVQETLARTGWRAGNTLAVIIDDVDFGDNIHSIYSYEGSLTYRAYLTIVYNDFIPQSLGLY